MKICRQIDLQTGLMEGMSTIFSDQMPTFHVFREVYTLLTSEFLIFHHTISQVKKENAHFQVELRSLNTHFTLHIKFCV
jgi:hypothetical protein